MLPANLYLPGTHILASYMLPSSTPEKFANCSQKILAAIPEEPQDLENLTETMPVTCRICYEDVHLRQSISPCLCKGTIAKVHTDCITTWIQTSGATTCELCGYVFKTSSQRKPMREWECPEWSAGEKLALRALIMFLPLITVCIVTGVLLLFSAFAPEACLLSTPWFIICLALGSLYVIFPILVLQLGLPYYSYYVSKFFRHNSNIHVFPASD